MAVRRKEWQNSRMAEMATYVLFMVHTNDDDDDTLIFYSIDRVEVGNKRLTKKPLIINLPDGRKVKSAHECDINIPGLPCTLTGHIVPTLAVASLFGIRPLCKAGCKVIFDNKKCEVVYEEKVILRGFKDASTDLWTLLIPAKGMQTTPGHVAKGTNISCHDLAPVKVVPRIPRQKRQRYQAKLSTWQCSHTP